MIPFDANLYYIADDETGQVMHGPFHDKSEARRKMIDSYGAHWLRETTYGIFTGKYLKEYGFKC